MINIRFLGKSDDNFLKGNVYRLINFSIVPVFNTNRGVVYCFITNEASEISPIMYSDINQFNNNWVVMED